MGHTGHTGQVEVQGPGVKVVDAKGNIQRHLAPQALPPHGVWVVSKGTVQISPLQPATTNPLMDHTVKPKTPEALKIVLAFLFLPH